MTVAEEGKSVSFQIEEKVETEFVDETQSSTEHRKRRASEGIVGSISPSIANSAHMTESMLSVKEEAIHENIVDEKEDENDDKFRWGGNMMDSINQHKGNMLLFAGDCMSLHGMYYAMYHNNGWLRTLAYLCIWLGFGAFFLYLTIPLIRSFNNGAVNTNFALVEGPEGGIPLPVVTVCPRGSGSRCDCLLWRRLYCHYTVNNFNPEFRSSFAELACIDQVPFQLVSNLVWTDPRCEDFSNSSNNTDIFDPCNPTPEDIAFEPYLANFTQNVLFDAAIAREQEFGEPFLTYGEISNYGVKLIGDNITFFRDFFVSDEYFVFPESEIVRYYWDVSRLQLCAQLRPNLTRAINTQTISGSRNGIAVMITGLRPNDFSVLDIAEAAAAVDVNIRIQSPGEQNADSLLVQRESYFPVRAGFISDVRYEVQTLQRKRGFGSLPSSTCAENTPTPRGVCVEFLRLQVAAQACGCADTPEGTETFNGVQVPAYSECAATDSEERQCLEASFRNGISGAVPFEQCPNPCTTNIASFVEQSELPILNALEQYLRGLEQIDNPNATFVAAETAILFIGLDSLVTRMLQEVPAVSFGSLMGSVGGNAGLWCGLSFVMVFEVIEFLVVAILFGKEWSRMRKRSRLWRYLGHPRRRRWLAHFWSVKDE